jgi:hypothetical protein
MKATTAKLKAKNPKSAELKAPKGKFRVVYRTTKNGQYYLWCDFETRSFATDLSNRRNEDQSSYYVFDDKGKRIPTNIPPKH